MPNRRHTIPWSRIHAEVGRVCQAAPRMRTSNCEREVGLTALGGSGRERESGEIGEGPEHSGTPATRGRDLCWRSAAHSTQLCLTSRRCSPDRNALGLLQGPGRTWRRVIKGPGEMGGAAAPGRSQSDVGRLTAWTLLEPPIRRRRVGGTRVGTLQFAGYIPRQQGAAESCAAGGGERSAGRAHGFPACPGADPSCAPAVRIQIPKRVWVSATLSVLLEPRYRTKPRSNV